MSKNQRERKLRSAHERATKHTSGFSNSCIKVPDGMELFTLKAGTMIIDIIPFKVGAGNPYCDEGEYHYERTYFAHRGVGPNGDWVICRNKTFNKACPVCEHRVALKKDPDVDEQVIKDLAPRERQLFLVIDRKNKDKGVQLWDISYHLFGKLLDERIKSDAADDSWKTFHDPENGMKLVLTVREKDFNGNSFCEVAAIDFKAREKGYSWDFVDQQPCLDDLLVKLSYDQLKAKLLAEESDEKDEAASGGSSEEAGAEEEEGGEEEAPKKPAKKPAREEEEGEEEGGGEEEEEAPKKPAKKPAKPAAEEEEEEGGEEGGSEEEEEAPKKPVKRPSALADEDDDAPPAKPAKKPAKPSSDDEDWDNDPPAKPAKKPARSEED